MLAVTTVTTDAADLDDAYATNLSSFIGSAAVKSKSNRWLVIGQSGS